MSTSYITLLILVFVATVTQATKLCSKDNYWYDADNGRCRPCTLCNTKSMELSACAEFRDTLCANLAFLKFDFSGRSPNYDVHKWHEMETNDQAVEGGKKLIVMSQERLTSDQSKLHSFTHGSVGLVAIIVVLCLAIAAVFLAILLNVMKIPRQSNRAPENGKSRTRFRLFSRDRLSTTEYMKSLATVDRRLAMDEILEKRRRAIFEPQLLVENVYSDEVFVDISSGIRHHSLQDDQEPTQRLLEANSQHA